MDLSWLKRLDVHLGAYEETGETGPLAALRDEIDCALYVCGLSQVDPRAALVPNQEEASRG